ncbi:MAG: excinuclease ABC subunit UvrC [Candidatus Micrarchaeota archaeon]
MASEFVLSAPHSPGVYLMKDRDGTVIYVGKAKDIKKRMGQYFGGRPLDTKTEQLVSFVRNVEFIITNNETEALILESNLIKKFKAKYNIDLRDSYRYPFVQITSEKFPRIIVVRRPKKNVQNQKFVYGPFVDAVARKNMISTVEKIFKIRTCHPLPKKACIKYFIDQCTAPCIGKASAEEYQKQVQKAKEFFEGKKEVLTEHLKTEMQELAKKRLFELAIQKRDLLYNLERQTERQNVDTFAKKDQDVIVYHKSANKFSVMVFPFRRGTLLGKKEFNFGTGLVDEDIVQDFVLNYYSEQKPPHEIVFEKKFVAKEQLDEMKSELSKLAGHKIEFVFSPKGEKKQVLLMAKKNLEYALNPQNNPLLELKNKLLLPKLPLRIECFDISHLGGEDTTASMVSFSNGKPDFSNYRHFRIKTVEGISDFDAMKEVIQRRYGGSLAWDTPLPDLVVVDGGKPQLSAALAALASVHVSLPVVALAKREEEIFVPFQDKAIRLKKDQRPLQILMNARDEAHRFANRLRKKLVKKKIGDK